MSMASGPGGMRWCVYAPTAEATGALFFGGALVDAPVLRQKWGAAPVDAGSQAVRAIKGLRRHSVVSQD
jgi:hypothetical protein